MALSSVFLPELEPRHPIADQLFIDPCPPTVTVSVGKAAAKNRGALVVSAEVACSRFLGALPGMIHLKGLATTISAAISFGVMVAKTHQQLSHRLLGRRNPWLGVMLRVS